MAETEQQQKCGIKRDLRQRRQDSHDRADHRVDRRTGRGNEPNDNANDDRDGKPHEQPKQRGRNILPECWIQKLVDHASEHLAGRRQQCHRRIAERYQRLPCGDQERDRRQSKQEVRRDGAAVHEKLKGISSCGSDHRTSRARILSNKASSPIPIAPTMMIMANTVSYSPMSSALNRMLPAPDCRAIISLVIMVIRASTSPVRQPVRISGNAAGNTMRIKRCAAESPIAAPDHNIFSSTAFAPSKLW